MLTIVPDIISNFTYVGIFFLMLVEAAFPFLPAEVILPLAGAMAAHHSLSLAGVIVAGTVGAVVGTTFWYVVAAALGFTRFEKFVLRYGRVFTIDEEEIAQGQRLFEKYGGSFVGVGRLLPIVRHIISIPAGLVRMHFSRYLLYSFIGTLVCTVGLTVAGFLLGNRFPEVHHLLGPVSTVVLALCLALYLYRVLTWKRRAERRAKKRAEGRA